MGKLEDDFEKSPFRTSLIVLIAIVIILAIAGLVATATGVITSPFRSAAGVIERTLNPDSVLYNYEWFKRQRQDVIAIDTKIKATEQQLAAFNASAGDRSKWTFEDKQESSRLSSVLLGLQGQRASMVGEYNARTEMANRDIFRAGDLPERLD